MSRPRLADFDRAIELDPTLTQAYYERGLLHAKAGRKGQAIADYRKVLEYNPSDGRARNGLGKLGVTLPPLPSTGGGGGGGLGGMY